MGNGGLFSFAYIYLSGNPVFGDVLYKRFLLTLVGLLICGTIYYVKHKEKYNDVTFKSKLKEFDFYKHKHQWMTRMSLGVALILTLGTYLNIERFMWAGFACGSLLSDHSENPQIKEKFIHRLIGVVAGSVVFYIIYSIIPENIAIPFLAIICSTSSNSNNITSANILATTTSNFLSLTTVSKSPK